MKKFEELLDKRNLEIELERKAIEENKAKRELEKERAIKERQRNEARVKADGINYSESVTVGLLYGFIGAIAGMIVIGLILWVVLGIILAIAGSKMDGDSILNLSGVIGLIVGALGGYDMGFYSKREREKYYDN